MPYSYKRSRKAPSTPEAQGLFFDKDSTSHSFFRPSQPTIQAKLTIGKPGDAFEREADAVADRVVNQPDMDKAASGVQRQEDQTNPRLQMQEKEEEEVATKPELQMQEKEEEEVATKPELQMQEKEEEEVATKPELQMQEKEEEEVATKPELQMQEKEEEEVATKPELQMQEKEEEEVATKPELQMQEKEEEEVATKPELQMQEKEEEEVATKPELQMQEKEEEEVATKPELQMQDKEEEEVATKPELQMQDKEEEEVATKPESQSPKAVDSLKFQLQRTKGQGHPLPKPTQLEMSNAFGQDFSTVRIHTDQVAVEMNRQLKSQAFSHGKDIYFNQGKFDPESKTGKKLLAHELTHVVQQKRK